MRSRAIPAFIIGVVIFAAVQSASLISATQAQAITPMPTAVLPFPLPTATYPPAPFVPTMPPMLPGSSSSMIPFSPTHPPVSQPQPGGEVTLGEPVRDTLMPYTGAAIYNFWGEAGDMISIGLTWEGPGSATVQLMSPNGYYLTEGYGRLFWMLTETGRYTAQIWNYGAETIPYELRVNRIPVVEMDFDEAMTISLTQAQDTAVFAFSAQAGDMIHLEAASSELIPYMILLLETGSVNNHVAWSRDVWLGVPAQGAELGPIFVPVTGRYIVNIRGQDWTPFGELTFRAIRLTAPEVAYGETVELALEGDQTRAYLLINGQFGDIIDVLAESHDGTDTRMWLRDSSGAWVWSDDDSGAGLNPEIWRVHLEANGPYLLEIGRFGQGDATTVDVTVRRNAQSSLDEGAQVAIMEKTNQMFSFEGEANETVRLTLNLREGGGNMPAVQVWQAGRHIVYFPGGSLQTLELEFIVPLSGGVLVTLSDDGMAARSVVDIELTRP